MQITQDAQFARHMLPKMHGMPVSCCARCRLCVVQVASYSRYNVLQDAQYARCMLYIMRIVRDHVSQDACLVLCKLQVVQAAC